MSTTKGGYGDPQLMTKLTHARMPFGKHSKSLLIDLPLTYLNWFSTRGFPRGELGQLMRIVYDIKSLNMEHLLEKLASATANLEPRLEDKS